MKTIYFTRHGKPTQQKREGNRFAKEDIAIRFYRHVEKAEGDGCWNWIGNSDPSGYGKFTWAKGIYKRAHRAAWVIAGNPELPPSVYLLHSCDNPACVRVEHLRPGTQKENIADMDARKRRPRGFKRPNIQGDKHHSRRHPELIPRGERSGQAKLTDDGVRQIRIWLSEGLTQREVADRAGISQSVISKISKRQSWAHVQ